MWLCLLAVSCGEQTLHERYFKACCINRLSFTSRGTGSVLFDICRRLILSKTFKRIVLRRMALYSDATHLLSTCAWKQPWTVRPQGRVSEMGFCPFHVPKIPPSYAAPQKRMHYGDSLCGVSASMCRRPTLGPCSSPRSSSRSPTSLFASCWFDPVGLLGKVDDQKLILKTSPPDSQELGLNQTHSGTSAGMVHVKTCIFSNGENKLDLCLGQGYV